MPRSRLKPATLSRLASALIIALFFTAIVQFAVVLPSVGARAVLVDFDAFYIVGQLFWEGRITEAYSAATMAQIQQEMVGHGGFMPWTYPPQFDLIALLLPGLPRGIAYGVFTASTLALYLWVLARLAGPSLVWILIALAPPIYVTTTIGQNAFLTGALMGLFALLTRAKRTAAGWPLGLLIIKPHLGVGLGVHALASGRWRVLALAFGVVLASSLLATLVMGADIWAAFLDGARQAGEALRTEFYPLYRMTSIYAALNALGAAPEVALTVQTVVGLLASAAIILAVRRGVPIHQTLAMACFTSALVSPYLYDYDMVVTGTGLALLASDIRVRTTTLDRIALLGLIWVAGGWGMIHALASAGLSWEDRAANARNTLSYGAFAYVLTLALLFRILRRAPKP